MLRRELTRVAAVGAVGVIIAVWSLFLENRMISPFIIPFYVLGTFYAGALLLRLLGRLIKMYFNLQFMSLLVNPLVGTVICLLVLCVGIMVLISFGWIIGIFRLFYCLYKSHQMDKEYIGNQQENQW